MYKKILHTFSSSFLFNVASLFLGYCAANLLGPYIIGIWQTSKIVLSYAGFLSLGTPFYLTRVVPKLTAYTASDKVEKIRQTVFSYNFFAAAASSLGIIIFTSCQNWEPDLKKSLYFVSIIILFESFSSLNGFFLKGKSRFVTVSKAEYSKLPVILICIALLYAFQFNGYLAGQVLLAVVPAIYFFIIREYGNKLSFSLDLFKDTIRVGFPIFLQNIIQIVFSTLDRLLIVTFLGVINVGFYSISSLLSTPFVMFVSSVSAVFLVENIKKSSAENDPSSISKNFTIPSNTISYFLPSLVGAMNLALPFVVNTLLPKFAEGIIPAQIVIWGMYFYSVSVFFANVLISIDKQKFIPIILLSSSLINLILGLLFIQLGYGLIGIALSTTVSYIVHFISVVFITHRFFKIENLKSVLSKYFLPIVFSVIVFAVLRLEQPDQFGFSILGQQIAIFMLITSPLLIVGAKNSIKILRKQI